MLEEAFWVPVKLVGQGGYPWVLIVWWLELSGNTPVRQGSPDPSNDGHRDRAGRWMGASKEKRGTDGWRAGSKVRICDWESRSPATCASARTATAEVLFDQPIRLYSRRGQEEEGESSQLWQARQGKARQDKVTRYGSRERRFPSNARRTKSCTFV